MAVSKNSFIATAAVAVVEAAFVPGQGQYQEVVASSPAHRHIHQPPETHGAAATSSLQAAPQWPALETAPSPLQPAERSTAQGTAAVAGHTQVLGSTPGGRSTRLVACASAFACGGASGRAAHAEGACAALVANHLAAAEASPALAHCFGLCHAHHWDCRSHRHGVGRIVAL